MRVVELPTVQTAVLVETAQLTEIPLLAVMAARVLTLKLRHKRFTDAEETEETAVVLVGMPGVLTTATAMFTRLNRELERKDNRALGLSVARAVTVASSSIIKGESAWAIRFTTANILPSR